MIGTSVELNFELWPAAMGKIYDIAEALTKYTSQLCKYLGTYVNYGSIRARPVIPHIFKYYLFGDSGLLI